ncbi:MAG: hypothetical protein JWQ11_564 [Rhizobacter sp.]|nr:hypothetical protein [Rhizobacter sp.]
MFIETRRQLLQTGTAFLLFVSSVTLGTLSLHCVRFGVSWLVMRETGSAAAFAALYGASSLVEIYAKPFVAPVADVFDRLVVMRCCMAGSAATAFALAMVALFLPFSVAALASLLMLSSLIAALRDPTAAALVPSLVNAERLLAAQSLRSTAGSVSAMAGAMLAALLLAAGGIPAAMIAGAAVSCMALVTMVGVTSAASNRAYDGPTHQRWLRTWHIQILDGFRAVWLTRAERVMAIVVALTNAGLFPFFAVGMPLWVARDLGWTPASMAAIEVAFSLGILVGSAWFTRVLNAKLGRYRALIVGNAMLGTGILMAAACSQIVPIVACLLVSGAGFATFNINASTLRAAATPSDYRARVAAGVAFLSSCLNPFSTQAFGLMIDHFSATTAVAISGALVLASTVLLRNADMRTLLSRRDKHLEGAYRALYPEAFGAVQRASRPRPP